MKYLLCIPCLLVVAIAVMIIRAVMLKPPKNQNTDRKPVNQDDEAVSRFQTILRQKTVWNRDASKIDLADFNSFVDVLKSTYPKVFKCVNLEIVNKYGLIIKMCGKDSTLKPAVIMGHYDVVTADESEWLYPPFNAEIHDGSIYARGCVDTKCIMCAVLEAMNRMLEKGTKPERDIYFVSAKNEEIGGDTTPAIVEWFKNKNISPYIVIDEGGAITSSLPLGVTNPFAMIGVCEKGSADVKLTVSSIGGHSSAPSKNDATIQMVKALNKIIDNPHKSKISETVNTMFLSLAAYSSFLYRLIFANMWLFKPLVIKIMQNSGLTNAMLRTTDALTMINGSNQINVLPTEVTAGFSVRISPGEKVDEAVEHMKKVCDNENVQFDVEYRFEPSPISDYNCEQCIKLKRIIKDIYTDVDFTPYIMNGGTDSKHFARSCNYVYRFAGFEFTGEERASIHSKNEHLKVESYLRGIEFYNSLIERI